MFGRTRTHGVAGREGDGESERGTRASGRSTLRWPAAALLGLWAATLVAGNSWGQTDTEPNPPAPEQVQQRLESTPLNGPAESPETLPLVLTLVPTQIPDVPDLFTLLHEIELLLILIMAEVLDESLDDELPGVFLDLNDWDLF